MFFSRLTHIMKIKKKESDLHGCNALHCDSFFAAVVHDEEMFGDKNEATG